MTYAEIENMIASAGFPTAYYQFPDGTGLKVTESRYYTPKGICIHGDGITPDHLTEDDPDTETDELIDAASAFLLGQ